jgi:hypothetical protein
LALELSSQVTDPVVQNVDGEWFPSDLNASDGFGVIHIPESTLPPHRVILSQKEIKNHYYIRSGESFVVASHTQLEDMFGRRPKPQLSFSVKIVPAGGSPGKQDFLIILGIENNGRGIAKSPLLCVKVYKPYSISRYGIDGNMHYGLNPLANSLRSEYERYGASGDIVLHSGIVHDVTAINFEIDWKKSPSEIQDLVIDYQIAAEGVMLIEGQKVIKGQEIWNICQKNP